LDKIGLTLNANSVADDPLPPFKPSGIRLGTPALTTRGLKEEHMVQIAEWMKQAIDARDDEAELAKIRENVKLFALKFALPSDI
jgi:glycine hydroxymethyltransferase